MRRYGSVWIRIGWLAGSNLVARYLHDICVFVVATPEYLERHGTPQQPTDLAVSGGGGETTMIEEEKLRAAFDTFEARSVAQLVALHAIFEELSAVAQGRVVAALRTAKESASEDTSPSRIKRLPLALAELEDLLTGDQ